MALMMSSDYDQFVVCEAFLIFAVTRFILSYVMNLLISSDSSSSSSCCSSSSSTSSSSSSSDNLTRITETLSLTTAGSIQHRLPAENRDDVCSSSCAVCLNSLTEKSQVWELRNCSHVFHKHCLEKWIAYESTCPLCRASLHAESTFLPPAPPPSWPVDQMLYLFGDDLLP
ncbi:hypothetical protein ACP275_12G135200 [Erythranthe tilingii]